MQVGCSVSLLRATLTVYWSCMDYTGEKSFFLLAKHKMWKKSNLKQPNDSIHPIFLTGRVCQGREEMVIGILLTRLLVLQLKKKKLKNCKLVNKSHAKPHRLQECNSKLIGTQLGNHIWGSQIRLKQWEFFLPHQPPLVFVCTGVHSMIST